MLAIILQTGAVIGPARQIPIPGFWDSHASAWSALSAFLSFIAAAVSAFAAIQTAREAKIANMRATRAALMVHHKIVIDHDRPAIEVTNSGPNSAHSIRLWVTEIKETSRGNYQMPDGDIDFENVTVRSEAIKPNASAFIRFPQKADAKFFKFAGAFILDWGDTADNREQIDLLISSDGRVISRSRAFLPWGAIRRQRSARHLWLRVKGLVRKARRT